MEAIEGVINELPNHEVYCNIISSGVGAVTESDVEFARVTNGMLFCCIPEQFLILLIYTYSSSYHFCL